MKKTVVAREIIHVYGGTLADRPGVHDRHIGPSYAIPVKDANLDPLPLKTIKANVDQFLAFARANAGIEFRLAPITSGAEEIAHLFKKAPANVVLPKEFNMVLGVALVQEKEVSLLGVATLLTLGGASATNGLQYLMEVFLASCYARAVFGTATLKELADSSDTILRKATQLLGEIKRD